MMASSREQTRSVCEPIFPYLVCTAHSLWRSVASSWPNFKCRWSFYFFSPAKYVADQNDDERGRGGKKNTKRFERNIDGRKEGEGKNLKVEPLD